MKNISNRRNFLRIAAVTGLGVSLMKSVNATTNLTGRKVGIIGLDTSHSTAFTKALNGQDAGNNFLGYKVVAAYPKGSNDIESSVSRIPRYIEKVKEYGVEIVDSIEELLDKVDVVLLETNDGRPHLEQALKVLKAGKRIFIDKPVAATFNDVLAIYKAAKDFNVPMFSSSALRYFKGVEEIKEKVGKVIGAETYSPCEIEKNHSHFYWYGIHGVEPLFALIGKGCKSVVCISEKDTDIVVGTWGDNRIGTFRGIRSGKGNYGGTVFGEKGISVLGGYDGYDPLLKEIVKFFESGKAPVSPDETIEIYAFMEAAAESRRQGGIPVELDSVLRKAKAGISNLK
jgi:hypothetical protein